MDFLCNELQVEILKYILTPISLILLNRSWYANSQNPHVRAEWLIHKYGRAHALFHAIRLGNNFITVEVVQSLLTKKAVLSRYFIQRLVMQFGTYDIPKPWASDLSPLVFTKFISSAIRELKIGFTIIGDDMEYFNYLTTANTNLSAPQTLFDNLPVIRDLILNKKFVPFPPRPRNISESEHHLLQNGYEDEDQLNIISRAILIYPDFVRIWKAIGYNNICSDFNELVMKEVLLIYYPTTLSEDWACPNVKDVAYRLEVLIKLGFQLTDDIIKDSIILFEECLEEIGDSLFKLFRKIRGDSVSTLIASILIEIKEKEKNES